MQQFAENETFEHLLQPPYTEVLNDSFELKGKWNSHFFKNDNPIVLEIGCGKGEYTVALAEQNPDKNFIGIDIKGNRLWTGATQVKAKGLKNAGFIRSKADYLQAFFGENEVSEIWLTFSDPQPKKPGKRLSSPSYLAKYRMFTTEHALIHLKTDNRLLYNSTLEVIQEEKLKTNFETYDLYQDWVNVPEHLKPCLEVKSYYEQLFLGKKYRINYLNFNL